MRRKLGSRVALPVLGLATILFVAGRADAVLIGVGDAEGPAGGNAAFDVTLVAVSSGEEVVVATQNDITYPPEAPIPGVFDEINQVVVADCAENLPTKPDSSFGFRPAGCATFSGTPPNVEIDTSNCTSIRALVVAFMNTIAIPVGTAMYTCNVAIEEGTEEGNLPLTCSNPGSSNAAGDALDTFCDDGVVTVGQVAPPTNTPTNTATATTAPSGPTSTPTRGANTPTRTRTFVPNQDDDGCQMVGSTSGHASWLLLAPIAVLLWRRRRG